MCGSVQFRQEQICAVTDSVSEQHRLVRSISSFYACSYTASYSQILNFVCAWVGFSFFVSMDILSEIQLHDDDDDKLKNIKNHTWGKATNNH